MKRLILVVFLSAIGAACGDSPTAPPTCHLVHHDAVTTPELVEIAGHPVIIQHVTPAYDEVVCGK